MKYLPLIWANLCRSPLRTSLTGTAITLAVLLVSLLLTMPDGLDTLLNRVTSNTRISVHNKAGLVYTMPASITRKIRDIDGVVAAVAESWFGGAFEETGQITFPNLAVEVEHIDRVYPDYNIAPEHLADFRRYRDGALVGRQTMQTYGWKIGDRVTLNSTIWPISLDFRIVGEIPSERAPLFWFNQEYLDQSLRANRLPGLGEIGIIWLRVDDPNRVAPVMAAIEELSRNSAAETACETEKTFFANFFGSLQDLMAVILVVTALVTLCIVFIAANTASMGVRERAGEIAVLKALGFTRNVIFATLLGETVTLAAFAGLVGVGLAFVVTYVLRGFAGWSQSLGPLSSFIVTPGVAVEGWLVAVTVGMLAGITPALAAARRPVIATLREVF